MPGKTTFFSRIQAMLELSAAKKPADSKKFLNGIEAKSPPNFVYYRLDPEKGERRDYCSRKSINNTFELAVDLGLLNEKTGVLTSDGKIAADPSKFDRLVTAKLKSHFEKLGFSIDMLEEESKKMLRGNTIVIPTADELYNRLVQKQDIEIPITKFRTLLRLLASCGGIRTNRRQIFLPANIL